MGYDNDRGHGRGSGGQGHGRESQFNKFQNNKSPEIKLNPHGSTKQGQAVTYASVKEHIISYVQRTIDYGNDIAGSLQTRLKTTNTDKKASTEKDMDTRKLEQDVFSIIHRTKIKQYFERVQALEENMNRPYALIIGTYFTKAITFTHIRQEACKFLQSNNIVNIRTWRTRLRRLRSDSFDTREHARLSYSIPHFLAFT